MLSDARRALGHGMKSGSLRDCNSELICVIDSRYGPTEFKKEQLRDQD
jgi:hypothetical protein